MSWNKSRPNGGKTNPKYLTPEHRATRARLIAELNAAGSGICAQTICVMRSRIITPFMTLHICHDPSGTIVLGLGHARCNLSDAGTRARAKQDRQRPYRGFTRTDW